MADLQYLDAQTIPYQVILREADGSYTDQYPQSFFAYIDGGGFVADNGTKNHFLRRGFDQIDWGACLPLPDPIPTDTEGYMAYLSILFTGQQGTLVPPTVTNMNILLSQPIGFVDLSVDGTFYISLNGTQGLATTVDEAYTQLNFNGDTVSMHAIASASTTDAVIDIILCKYDGIETELLTMKVLVATDGVIKSVAPFAIADTDYLYYKLVVPAGTGTVFISAIALELQPA